MLEHSWESTVSLARPVILIRPKAAISSEPEKVSLTSEAPSSAAPSSRHEYEPQPVQITDNDLSSHQN